MADAERDEIKILYDDLKKSVQEQNKADLKLFIAIEVLAYFGFLIMAFICAGSFIEGDHFIVSLIATVLWGVSAGMASRARIMLACAIKREEFYYDHNRRHF